MNILFRVDASKEIGTGHVVRCLTLADALTEKGVCSYFVCKNHEGNLIDFIQERGFEAYKIPVINYERSDLAHSHWLGSSIEEDAALTLKVIGNSNFDCCVVDHYAIDIRWEEKVSKKIHKLMVIDDLADRLHRCDILLDQNYFGDSTFLRYDKLVDKNCRKYLGPQFALLKKDFQVLSKDRNTRKQVNRILLFFGGSDLTNQTKIALEAICDIPFSFNVDVVLGTNYQWEASLIEFTKKPFIRFHKNLPSLSELMTSADLMIGAGGTTTWERMSLGLPAIVVTTADNQKKINESLADKSLLIHLGDFERITVNDYRNALIKILNKKNELYLMSERLYNFNNSNGFESLVNEIIREEKF